MKYNLDTERSQSFRAFYQGILVCSFYISPVFKVFRKTETFYTQNHTDIDSLIAELQYWKSKGVTKIESWGYNDDSGYSYDVVESDDILKTRIVQYQLDLKEQEIAYDIAFRICDLIDKGYFAEADRELTKLRNNRFMYSLQEY
jgi:hypothetical protein